MYEGSGDMTGTLLILPKIYFHTLESRRALHSMIEVFIWSKGNHVSATFGLYIETSIP